MRGEVPGQKVIDAVDRMLCDALEDAAQVGLRIQTVELG